MHESMGDVDFETLLILLSALIFLLFFTAIAFCLTDYKLCYYQATNQKIFADEVISNTLALEKERAEHRRSTEEDARSEEVLKDLESNIRIVQERYRDDVIVTDDSYKAPESDIIVTEIVSKNTDIAMIHKRSDTVTSIVMGLVSKVGLVSQVGTPQGNVGTGPDQWAVPVSQELSAIPQKEVSQISDV